MEEEETQPDTDYVDRLKNENIQTRELNSQLSNAISGSNFGKVEDPNLIQYQLENMELLNKIEHFLKGDVFEYDAEGNGFYNTPEDDDLILFNEYGVNSIMLIVGIYIDKLTSLSYYSEERINEILADLGDAIADFIFCNYERMGMTTEFKKSRFNLIVINILHSVESTYRKAIKGRHLEELNSSKIYTESNINRPMPLKTPKKSWSLNPFKVRQ